MSAGSPVVAWLRAREPAPPPELMALLERAVSELARVRPDTGDSGEAVGVHAALADAAMACLDRALGTADRRASAFALLAADALITYACEAAAETGPDALDWVARHSALRRAGAPARQSMSNMEMDRETVTALVSARVAEREQTLFYRALAAAAEDQGLADLAERLNELHADEQHQLSRLTARLLELGERVEEVRRPPPAISLEGWEETARQRERDEVARYESLRKRALDPATATLIDEILRAERQHEQHLGGKWMSA